MFDNTCITFIQAVKTAAFRTPNSVPLYCDFFPWLVKICLIEKAEMEMERVYKSIKIIKLIPIHSQLRKNSSESWQINTESE